MKTIRTLLLPACFGAAALLPAQFGPLLPYPRTLDLLVVDSTLDGVWRLADRNMDGDYNDRNEVTVFYDDVTGATALTNPDCIVWARDGVAYVGDSTADIVLALEDRNGDGDANDPGEHTVFFDSAANAGNIVMASVQGMTTDSAGNLFLAVSNAGSSGQDMILQLRDTNGDGDANDPGEAKEYCIIPNSQSSVGDSIPTQVLVGPDTKLYYADVGSTGANAKGIYRLDDLNADGDCNDPGEVQLYWSPNAPGNAFYWGMTVDRTGTFYLTDHGNELIWAGRDQNADGKIDTTEERVFHTSPPATWWEILLRDDGKLLVCEDQTPDRILAFQDLNNDGDADDAGERIEVYSDLTSPVDLTKPRAAALMRAPTLNIQPATARLGDQVNIAIETSKRFEPALLLFSVLPANLPSPPFGVLGLDPATLALFVAATSNKDAAVSLSFTVPNDTALIHTWPFQVVAGDAFRPFLSQSASLKVQ